MRKRPANFHSLMPSESIYLCKNRRKLKETLRWSFYDLCHIFYSPPIYYKDKVYNGGVKVSREYYRAYIILKQDTRGYSFTSKEPSGYCKVDAYGDQAKIQVYVQDLKPIPKEKGYRFSLLANLPAGPRIVPIESFYVDEKGKRDIKISVNRNNVGGSGLSIEQFEGAVITAEDAISPNVPLVGFKKEPFAWKSLLNAVSVKHESEVKVKSEEEKETLRAIKTEGPTEDFIKEPDLAKKAEEAKSIGAIQEIKEERGLETIEQTKAEETAQKDEFLESIEVAESNFETSEVEGLLASEASDREVPAAENGDTDFFSYFTPEKHEEFLHHKPKKENFLNKILRENIRMNPFERNKEYMEWYRISYEELPLLLNYPWRWYSNPYLLIGAKKYNHLLLGRNVQLNTYCLAVPDIYFPAAKEKAKVYGFNYFLCCRNTRPAPGEYGYWIMDLPPISFELD